MDLMDFTEDEIRNAIKNGEITVSIIGLGRIGLPTAVIFAENGIRVIGVDINDELIRLVSQGKSTLDEPGLGEIIEKVVKTGNLKVTNNLKYALNNSQVIIICLPTPITGDKTPNYSIIEMAIKKISKELRPGHLIIIESTVSPSTVEDLLIPILEKGSGLKCGKDFCIANCPERANPGNIIKRFRNTPRIVGGITEKCTDITGSIYSSVIDAKIIKMKNIKTASAVKLTENIFRDVNIALINELAILYERLGIDIYDVIAAASTKWNFIPHYPGSGVGGPCLPANPYFLIEEAIKVGYKPYLIQIAREINDRMPDHMIELIQKTMNYAEKFVKNSKIGILGVSYKPNIKDYQLSPVFPIVSKLKDLDAEIKIFDPFFLNYSFSNFTTEDSLESAVKDSDCLVIITNHNFFQNLDLNKIKTLTKNPLIIIDGRNTLKITDLPKNTIYKCIGRPIFVS
ncbi:MAG: nucleotide sugar dehydrogenase [Candidatus Helarchaeota archaeon]